MNAQLSPANGAPEDRANISLGRRGEACAKRIFQKIGGLGAFEKDNKYDAIDFAARMPKVGIVAVQVKAYGFQPDTRFGGLTGIDEKEIDKLVRLELEMSATPVWVFFVDYILKRVYWAPLSSLMIPFEFEDLAGEAVRFPIKRAKHGTTMQLLWPPLWFQKVLGHWEPMSDLEAGGMRVLRRPTSNSGLMRLGHEDEEAASFEKFGLDWERRHSQASLF